MLLRGKEYSSPLSRAPQNIIQYTPGDRTGCRGYRFAGGGLARLGESTKRASGSQSKNDKTLVLVLLVQSLKTVVL